MVNPDKIRDKIQFIQRNLGKLQQINKKSQLEFLQDPFMLDAATRLLQISIEAVLDISQHIVSRKHLGIPKTYRESVELLAKSGILSKKKLPNLINMIKFRNRAVHLYDDISGEEIYKIIQYHLSEFEDFISSVVACCLNGD
jgi:uncharacterized protein YutE (UPF0331/DUF86 family)